MGVQNEEIKMWLWLVSLLQRDQTYQNILLNSTRTNVQCAVVPHMFCVGTSLFPPLQKAKVYQLWGRGTTGWVNSGPESGMGDTPTESLCAIMTVHA